MGGGGKSKTKVKYMPAPAPPQDNSFQQYLQYAQNREQAAERRAAQERAEEKQRQEARRERGRAALDPMRSNLQRSLDAGLISYGDAASQIRDFGAQYDIGGETEKRASELSEYYTSTLLPQKRQQQIKSAYKTILGRDATADEITDAMASYQAEGWGGSSQGLRSQLKSGSEYRDKFNQSYLDNYYDTMYGKQTKTADGKQTGKRTFAFTKDLLPQYDGDLKGKTGITMPDYENYFKEARTVAELDEQRQGIRQSRQFMYQAGLTNLQGDIDKEINKVKTEGTKSVAKIKNKGQLYGGLTAGFFGAV
jgi:hypothetical protein